LHLNRYINERALSNSSVRLSLKKCSIFLSHEIFSTFNPTMKIQYNRYEKTFKFLGSADSFVRKTQTFRIAFSLRSLMRTARKNLLKSRLRIRKLSILFIYTFFQDIVFASSTFIRLKIC
jgi:hypothetical protein